MDKERFLQSGLLEQYVLGLTTPDEDAEVERYAAAFPEIKQEIDKLRKAITKYAEEQIQLTPEEKLGSAATTSSRSTRRFRLNRHHALMALLLVFGLLGFYYHYQWDATQGRLDELHKEYRSLRHSCEDNEAELSDVRSLLALLAHPATQAIDLSGTARHARSTARIFANSQTGTAYLYIDYLPPIGESESYHLWKVVNGEMSILDTITEPHSQQLQPIHYVLSFEELLIGTQPPLAGDSTKDEWIYARTANKSFAGTDTSATPAN